MIQRLKYHLNSSVITRELYCDGLAEYHKDQNIEELADLLEVIYAATKARGYNIEDLERIRKEKADKRGTFDKKIFLETVIENE